MTKLRLLLLATTALTAVQFASIPSHAQTAPLVVAQAKEELGPDGKPKPKEAPKAAPPARPAPPAAAPPPRPAPPPHVPPPAAAPPPPTAPKPPETPSAPRIERLEKGAPTSPPAGQQQLQ